MRKRDEIWARAFVENASMIGDVTAEVKTAAAVASDRTIAVTKDPVRQQQMAESKFQTLIRKPDVREAIRSVFAEIGGLTPERAVQLLRMHAEGEITKDVVSKVMVFNEQGKPSHQETVVDQVRLPPSFPALKVYLDMTMPKAPTEVRTRNEHLHGWVPPPPGSAPETEPRPVGQTVAAAESVVDEGTLLHDGEEDEQDLEDDDETEDE